MTVEQQDITGRDDFIITEALGLAIAAIDAMPKEHRSWSNQQDMVALIRHRLPDAAQREALADRIHLSFGFKPDFTDHKRAGGDEPPPRPSGPVLVA